MFRVGNLPFGIVYSTDAQIEPRVRYRRFPANTHEPIIYPVALVKDARPAAGAFLNYLQGPQARQAFERAGFGCPKQVARPLLPGNIARNIRSEAESDT